MTHLYPIIVAQYAVILLYTAFIIHIVTEKYIAMFRRYFVNESIRQAALRFGANFQLPCSLRTTPVYLPYDALADWDSGSILYYNALTPRALKKLHVPAEEGLQCLVLVPKSQDGVQMVEAYTRSPSTDFRSVGCWDRDRIQALCHQSGLDPVADLRSPEFLDLVMQDCMSDAFAAPFMKSCEPLSRRLKEINL